jgi:hypothetical protein
MKRHLSGRRRDLVDKSIQPGEIEYLDPPLAVQEIERVTPKRHREQYQGRRRPGRELTPEEMAEVVERSRAGLLVTAEEHAGHKRYGGDHDLTAHILPSRRR